MPASATSRKGDRQLRKITIAVVAFLLAIGLSGCSEYIWNFCVNGVYTAEYVVMKDGDHIRSQYGYDGWIVVDVSIANITDSMHTLASYNNQFLLIDMDEGKYYDNAAFVDSMYGIDWDLPVYSRSTIRAELYFDAPPGILEEHQIGIVMKDGVYVEPTAMGAVPLSEAPPPLTGGAQEGGRQ